MPVKEDCLSNVVILLQFTVNMLPQNEYKTVFLYSDFNIEAVFALIFFHLLTRKPNLEKLSIYSNKFFHNFHLSESSFTCPGIRDSAKTVCAYSLCEDLGIVFSISD